MEIARTAKGFLPYSLDQRLLLPPDMRAWLADGHLALFVSDVVDALDLSAIFTTYAKDDHRGRAGYHPAMMVKLLVYGYAIGVTSSRKLEKKTSEDVPFRVLSGDQHPDHDSIASFRKRHLSALGGLFLQVLVLCRKAGLVKLGHVSLDGTKIKANASKHKAMSYERMRETEKRLRHQVREWFRQAKSADEAEDRLHGSTRRGDEMPSWIADKQQRITKIREAREALEAEARAAGQAAPEPKAQRNFTDPESRIMRKSGKEYVQAYNAQAAVDSTAQVIVAQSLSNNATDVRQLAPTLKQIKQNTGRQAQEFSADAGYCSEGNLAVLARHHVDSYIATGRQRHHEGSATGRRRTQGSRVAAMRTKLARAGRRSRYRLRKSVVEPVFGQIKQARGFRQFMLRGLEKAQGEWSLICTVHNLLKLAKAMKTP